MVPLKIPWYAGYSCGSSTSQLGKTANCVSTLAVGIAPYSITETKPQGGFQVRSNSHLLSPVPEVHDVFSKTDTSQSCLSICRYLRY